MRFVGQKYDGLNGLEQGLNMPLTLNHFFYKKTTRIKLQFNKLKHKWKTEAKYNRWIQRLYVSMSI